MEMNEYAYPNPKDFDTIQNYIIDWNNIKAFWKVNNIYIKKQGEWVFARSRKKALNTLFY